MSRLAAAGSVIGVKNLLLGYRVLATVVGLSIITLVLIGLPLKYTHTIWPSVLPEGSGLQQLGSDINLYLGIAHGYIYMGFVLVAFMLSRKANWPLGFTLLTLFLGTVPVLSFWAEHRAVTRIHAEHPETVATASA